MKILELEIHNVRGIPHIELKPEGKNFVVYGPNASGKSAIVDAIDFLLTGRISRLMGKGTAGITLKRHGPHIDHKPKDARVKALVQLAGIEEPVEIERCMEPPAELECDESVRPHLEKIVAFAKQGQHVLTRREILKYITAEASSRAEGINELLNIVEIEELRKAFVNVKNTLGEEHKRAKQSVAKEQSKIQAALKEQFYDENVIWGIINAKRKILGGEPTKVYHSSEIRKNLTRPAATSKERPVNITLLKQYIDNLLQITSSESKETVEKENDELREVIETIKSDPELLKILKRRELTERGLKLIDESGSCPLCDTPWPPGKLREYLEQKLEKAQKAAKHQKRIDELSDGIMRPLNVTIESIKKIIPAIEILELKDYLSLFNSWCQDLGNISMFLNEPIERYPPSRFSSEQIKQMLAPKNLKVILEKIHMSAKNKFPEATPQEEAWDLLTQLEVNLKSLEDAERNLKSIELASRRAGLLLNSFLSARDEVLEELYKDIEGKFVSFYRELHKTDEGDFNAQIVPDQAGLNLDVDFYGRGMHPPQALHSEGHQDSMGVCLYLALAEKLTEGVMDLIILDDVVMSVDAEHRRHVCDLLRKFFPSRQFLITTHDRTWANQLKSSGIVTSRGTVEFYSWNVDTGPQVNYEPDMWNRIREDIERGDIPAAAAKLRRGLEAFFGMACDKLRAEARYRLDGQNELGDFLPAAWRKYRKLLKQAKDAASSWGRQQPFDDLQALGERGVEIYNHSTAEQWAVNPNVHYASWADFTKQDFEPVVQAFKELCCLFECNECEGMLYVTLQGLEADSVRCRCGKINWNLKKKGE